jgi:hypothetical protein
MYRDIIIDLKPSNSRLDAAKKPHNQLQRKSSILKGFKDLCSSRLYLIPSSCSQLTQYQRHGVFRLSKNCFEMTRQVTN